MRAVVVTEPGGPERMQLQDVPDPSPGPGEVVVEVRATAVNRADVIQRQGNYRPPPGAAPYLGLECSGTIVELGESVAGWSVGDEVCALLAGGGYAERVAVPVGQLLPVPRGVTLEHAAALPEVSCTVWSMVFGAHAGRLQPGERLLVHGGSSGIGTMAIQLAHQRGAQVFTTARSAAKLAVCEQLGAELLINYREELFDDRVLGATDGAGADVILDMVGAAYLPRNVKTLAIGGRLVVLGLLGGRTGDLDLSLLLRKRATIHSAGLRPRPLTEKAGIVAETQHAVWPLIEAGQVRPIIDREYPLADVAEAHRRVEASEHIGKVILRVR